MKKFYSLRINILICIGMAITVIGCTKEPQTEDFININDQYELMLHQELTPNGGVPSLQITSIEPQECTNSYISHQTIITEKKLHLLLNDILIEGDCDKGSNYASENILVGPNAPEISIEISLKNVIENSGILYTRIREFDLDLHKFDGLKITKTKLNRIYPGMIWGSYSHSDENIALQIEEFLNNSNYNQSPLNGDYGHFYLAQDKTVTLSQIGIVSNNNFLISGNDNFEIFKTEILDFKNLADGLVFHATNFDGSLLIIE
jgi:hypothetical protein